MRKLISIVPVGFAWMKASPANGGATQKMQARKVS